MSSSVHGSYDFYNNGTSYFNGTVIVDDHLSVTGTSAQLTLSRTSTDQTAGFNLTNNQNGGYGSGIVWQSKRSDSPYLLKDAAKIVVAGENAWNSDSNTASQMQFWTNKDNTLTKHMTLTKNGYLGIGTDSPVANLHVKNTTTTTNSAVMVNRTETAFGWEEEWWFNALVTATTAGTAYVTFQFSNPNNTNLHNMHIDYTFGCWRVGGAFGGNEGDTVKGTGSYWNNGSGGDSARSGEAEIIGVSIINNVYIETTGTYAFRLAIEYIGPQTSNKNISGKIKLLNNPATGTSPAVTVTV